MKNGNFMTSHLKNNMTDWSEIFTEVKTCQYLVTQQISDRSVDSGEMTGWLDMEFPYNAIKICIYIPPKYVPISPDMGTLKLVVWTPIILILN